MISDKLRSIIFDRLYVELSDVEIIPFNDSIWFIDREKQYWYFEFQKDGILWWRFSFFMSFFSLFSLEPEDYRKIMSEWVEEVLNCKVIKINPPLPNHYLKVKDVIKYSEDYNTLEHAFKRIISKSVLEHTVVQTCMSKMNNVLVRDTVEKVLNRNNGEVKKTRHDDWDRNLAMNRILGDK